MAPCAAYDAKLDLVYLPMGRDHSGHWAGITVRRARALCQLIVGTERHHGKLPGSYQTVHHDLWDMSMLPADAG
ncbi:hypothetical protein LAD77_29960 [Klebsiella pneumoniae]|nr:hypothetical protein [Klebsiella pneumoniae]